MKIRKVSETEKAVLNVSQYKRNRSLVFPCKLYTLEDKIGRPSHNLVHGLSMVQLTCNGKSFSVTRNYLLYTGMFLQKLIIFYTKKSENH